MKLYRKLYLIACVLVILVYIAHHIFSYTYAKEELESLARNTVSEQAEIVDSLDGGGFVFYLVRSGDTTKLVTFQKNVVLPKYKLSGILDANESESRTAFDDRIENYLVQFNRDSVEILSQKRYFFGSHLSFVLVFFVIFLMNVGIPAIMRLLKR
ncbi:MAG: hypothetical protein LBC26_02600 [Oscillospiraceae bacterium]|nr:hypothetical protein [Oscillospiraceae bacterium]